MGERWRMRGSSWWMMGGSTMCAWCWDKQTSSRRSAGEPDNFAQLRSSARSPSGFDLPYRLLGREVRGLEIATVRGRKSRLDQVLRQEVTEDLQGNLTDGIFIASRQMVFDIPDDGPKADMVLLAFGQDALLQGFEVHRLSSHELELFDGNAGYVYVNCRRATS